MGRFVIFLIFLTFFSCSELCSVIPDFICKNEKLDCADLIIDFTKIDQYPSFYNCDEMLSFEKGKTCFEQTFYKKLSRQISNLKLDTNVVIRDTLSVKFRVDKKGRFFCKKVTSKMKSLKKISSLISKEIKKKIDAFPLISPAQKRGIPVNADFLIFIYVDTK